MPTSKTVEALAFAAKNGNTKCFEELYRLYYDKIYALALTIVKHSEDAEDALQMTFVKAWQNLDKLDNTSAFNTWIQRITINQCNSMMRVKKYNYSIDDEGNNGELLQIESDLMLPEQYAERDDLANRLKAIIDELSLVQRETILLYYYNDMCVDEIAQTMECSAGTVKSRLFLARKAIRTEIEEHEKKSGEKFYGIAGVAFIPFAGLFISQIKNASISGSEAANVFNRISNTLFNTPLNPANTARLSGNPKVHKPSHSKISFSKAPAGTAAKASATLAKSSFPLWAKIASIGVGVGLLTGSGFFIWNTLRNKDANPIVNASVGDEFTFGKYEQDNNTDNGAEDITWRVLARENNKLFVISKYALDCVSYSDYSPKVLWGDSGIRKTLNTSFLTSSFSENEQNMICDTYILSEDTGTNESGVSADKVFLMSNSEAENYFSSNGDRIAAATKYAIKRGAPADKKNHTVWWLRSRVFENAIGAVYENGNPNREAGGQSGSKFALRPVMWIDADAIDKDKKAGTVVQPVETDHLSTSLKSFLNVFALHYFDHSYNCEDITKESNILYGVIGESECVDYGLYSESMAKANEYENWVDSSRVPSPVEDINSKKFSYKVLDGEDVDFILKNIFHCSESDIIKMRGWKSTGYPYGYADGKYYCGTGGHGDIGNEFVYVDGKYKDGCCYYTLYYYNGDFALLNNGSIEGIDPTATIYIKASLSAHEGKPWWTLHYYSTEPLSTGTQADTKKPDTDKTESATTNPDDNTDTQQVDESSDTSRSESENSKTEQTENVTSDTSDKSWSDIYKDFILNKKYTSSGEGWLGNDAIISRIDDNSYPYFYIYDLNNDQTPELFMSFEYMAASVPLNVYTVKDNKPVLLSNITSGGQPLIYNTDSDNRGLFNGSGRQGIYTVQYWYMNGDTLEKKEVLTEKAKNAGDFSQGFNTTIYDNDLYDTFIGCTKEGGLSPAISSREAVYSLPAHSQSEIKAMGWDSYINEYNY